MTASIAHHEPLDLEGSTGPAVFVAFRSLTDDEQLSALRLSSHDRP